MGDPDPSKTIVAETNRVPFKESNMHPNLWDKRASIRNRHSIMEELVDQSGSLEENRLGTLKSELVYLFVSY